MSQPTVSIYSTPTCHFCGLAKEFFKEHNVAYTEYNVAADAEKRTEMIDKSGNMGVPQIYVGNEFILGFDEPKLRELLAIA